MRRLTNEEIYKGVRLFSAARPLIHPIPDATSQHAVSVTAWLDNLARSTAGLTHQRRHAQVSTACDSLMRNVIGSLAITQWLGATFDCSVNNLTLTTTSDGQPQIHLKNPRLQRFDLSSEIDQQETQQQMQSLMNALSTAMTTAGLDGASKMYGFVDDTGGMLASAWFSVTGHLKTAKALTRAVGERLPPSPLGSWFSHIRLTEFTFETGDPPQQITNHFPVRETCESKYLVRKDGRRCSGCPVLQKEKYASDREERYGDHVRNTHQKQQHAVDAFWAHVGDKNVSMETPASGPRMALELGRADLFG